MSCTTRELYEMGVAAVAKRQPIGQADNDVRPSGGRPKRADEEIAAAIDAGEHRKAVLLCSRHHGAALGRLCMAMLGSQQDAEDVTQETLLAAFGGLQSWRREGSMRAWLMTIARRKCARIIEKRVRRTAKLRLVHDADVAAPSSAGAEAQVLMRERATRARDALSTLRPTECEAVLLRYAAGLAFREVGLACGIDEATARKRVSRAIARLRDAIEQEGSER